MKAKSKTLLLIDGTVNLLVGISLLLFPFGMGQLLGVPLPNINFYPTILGAVIFGIGIALLLEAYGEHRSIQGLRFQIQILKKELTAEKWPAVVKVVLRNDHAFSLRKAHPKGSPKNPMKDEEFLRKLEEQ